MTQTDLGRVLKLSKTAVSGYEIGDAAPALDTVAALAEIGDVTCGWIIMGKSEDSADSLPDTLTPEEQKLLEGFRSVNHTDQTSILRIVEGLTTLRKQKTKP